MKNFKINSILVLLVVFCYVASLPLIHAQEEDEGPMYISMWCLKTKNQEAMPLIKDIMKPFEESLIKEGLSVDWFLMAVEFPNGENCDCDYYAVQMFRDHKLMEFFASRELPLAHFKKNFPDKNPMEVMEKFKAAIESGPTQIYQVRNAVQYAPVKSQFASVNFMNVAQGDGEAYLKMENDVFKPLHQEAVKSGHLADWVVMERILPRGTAFPGNFITVDLNGSMENVMKGPDMEALWKKVHPDKDMASTMKKMMDLRELYRTELWQSAMRAEVKSETTTSKN